MLFKKLRMHGQFLPILVTKRLSVIQIAQTLPISGGHSVCQSIIGTCHSMLSSLERSNWNVNNLQVTQTLPVCSYCEKFPCRQPSPPCIYSPVPPPLCYELLNVEEFAIYMRWEKFKVTYIKQSRTLKEKNCSQ